MPIPFRFKLSLSDGENALEVIGTAEWLPGGDNQVLFKAGPVTVEQGELLDNWESAQTQLDASLEVAQCVEESQGGLIPTDCGDLADYASQSGKATITWVYGPTETKIYLTFVEVE